MISELQEKVTKADESVFYSTTHLKGTENLYYENHRLVDFDAEIIEVFANIQPKNARNIVILDRSAFYPTSSGN